MINILSVINRAANIISYSFRKLLEIVERKNIMLYTIAVILIILWLLGLVTSYTMGGVIHILLVIAIIMVLVRIISGRRAL